MKIKSIIFLVFIAFLIESCRDEPPLKHDLAPFKVAVLMPLSGDMQGKWETGIDWIKSTINNNGGVAGRKIEIEWHNSQVTNIEEVANKIATDTSIVAAIGPFVSSNIFKVAPYFIKNKKLLFTTASSSEITRAYAGKDYIWRLIESDISQCKNLILIAKNKNISKIGLIVGDDEYGMSFYNWFGFFASEMEIEITRIERFDASSNDVSSNMQSVLNSKPELVVCVPSNINQAIEMADQWQKSNNNCQILFSDIVYMPQFINENNDVVEGVEGTVMIPDPTNGFAIEYEIKYGEKPLLGVAQMYDALMLIAYALEVSHGAQGEDLMEALKLVVDGRDGKVFWDDYGVVETLKKLRANQIPDIIGASGSLNYDDEYYLDVLSSTYAHWQINQSEFITLNYYSDDGNGRHSPTSSSWRTYATQIEELTIGKTLSILPKENLKVLLIASSKGWTNYRHQADVLAYYQMLRKRGVSDEDIILIIEDDLANNQRNKEYGVIKNDVNGVNLYENVDIDYSLEEITPEKLFNILMGISSDEFPIVINSTNQTNILFYFIGHGSPDGLIIEGEKKMYLTPQFFNTKLKEIASVGSFRKLLILIEACYSGNMGQEIDINAPIMCITAANSFESSKAINYSNTLNAWLSNNFSYHMYEELIDNSNISIFDMYVNINKKVNGSHVSIYNEKNFGNINLVNINDFFNH